MEKEERQKKSEERVSDVRVHDCPRSTHVYGSGRRTERPAAMSLDAYSWKLYLFRANAMIARTTSDHILVTCFYVRVTTLLLCWYLDRLTPAAHVLSVLVLLLQSKT